MPRPELTLVFKMCILTDSLGAPIDTTGLPLGAGAEVYVPVLETAHDNPGLGTDPITEKAYYSAEGWRKPGSNDLHGVDSKPPGKWDTEIPNDILD